MQKHNINLGKDKLDKATEHIRTVKELNVINHDVVIVRTNYDVPIKDGLVAESSRIYDSVKTIDYLYSKGAKIVIVTHLDRPKGKVNDRLRLDVVAKEAERIFKREISQNIKIKKFDNIVDNSIKEYFANKDNIKKFEEMVMLENIRFDKREENNDHSLANDIIEETMAKYYVNEAFAVSHRNHCSVVSLPKLLDTYAGISLMNEINKLYDVVHNYQRPFIAIIGGAKLKTKLGVIKTLISKVDKLIIVGAMVFTFLKAKGIDVGNSIVDDDYVKTAKEILDEYKDKLYIPNDFVLTDSINEPQIIKELSLINNEKGFNGMIGVDIGQESTKHIVEIIKKANTIIWNGPVGVFENEKFAKGSIKIAQAIAELNNKKVVIGGGDTLNIFRLYSINKDNVWHVSMGGGAMLKFIEGKPLPGIEALRQS